jgi:hypothetical protein
VPPVQNYPRYKYVEANMERIHKTIQFEKSFICAESVTITYPYSIDYDKWSVMLDAAKYVNLCNDDTVTFSTTYTEMKQNATYWLSHLPPFNQNTFAIVQGTNAQRIPHICVFVLHNDRIVVIPIVLNVLFVLYKAYPNNTPIHLLYTNTLDKARDQLRSILSVTDANCKQQNRYPNFEPFVDYFIKT